MEDLLFILVIATECFLSRVLYSMGDDIIMLAILAENNPCRDPRRFLLALILWDLLISYRKWRKWLLRLLVWVDSMEIIRGMWDYVSWFSLLHSIDMIYLLIGVNKHSLGSWHLPGRAAKWMIHIVDFLTSWLRLIKDVARQWRVEVVCNELLF